MADPVTIAVASLAATVIGSGVSAYGAMAQGAAQKQMYDYQAQVAQFNAQIAATQSNVAQEAAEVQAQKVALQGEETREAEATRIAAGGLDLGSGSAKAVLASQTEITQHDEAMTRWEGEQKAYSLRVQSVQDTMQGQLDVAAGVGAEQAATFTAGTSLLGGAQQFGDRYVKYSQAGVGILS